MNTTSITSTRQLAKIVLGAAIFCSIHLEALDLGTFRTCVSAAGSGSTCILDPNWNGTQIIPWDVIGTEIKVERPVTAKGNDSYPGQVKLKRQAALTYMMTVTASATGSTIRNIEFDGSGGTYTGTNYVDLNFEYGSYNNFVQNSTFRNAAGWAVVAPFYTYVQTCNFYNSNYGSVLAFSGGNDGTDIGVYTSYFERAGINAVYMHGSTRNSIVFDSDFFENHYTCISNNPGGQIILEDRTTGIYVQNNVVDGNYSSCPFPNPESSAGLEGYGTSHQITGNTFKNHRWFGIYFTASSAITISNNIITANWKNGINLSGTDGILPCSSSATYSITGNTITSNLWYGLYAQRSGCSAGPSSSTVTQSGNSYSGNGFGSFSLNNP